ncbi:MAG: hypothetical protein WBA12_08865 [Catalinimonas sp.]
MTTTEIRAHLHSKIDHLSAQQLQKVQRIIEKTLQEEAAATAPKRQLGVMKGKIWLADDWDSPETNEEIARSFNDGPVFPE